MVNIVLGEPTVKFGQAEIAEMLGGVEYLSEDSVGLGVIAVTLEARRHDRVVVRPYAAIVVAHRIVRRAGIADSADAPAGGHVGLHQALHYRRSLALVHDAAP